jgi:Protein kinase domain
VAIAPGSRFGPYEIQSRLGAGGMGEVYRAHDARLGRDLAIKILPPEMIADPDRLARFEKEARLTSALNHPNIVTIFDIGRAGGIPYIAMELVQGSTLREFLPSGLPMRRVLDVSAQIAEGLARAHESGIVHRDLKPANVMITPDGLVKILDFGLGKRVTPLAELAADAPTMSVAAPATMDGRILGTVDYMSPEQALGRPVDFRSDQFSFGSLLSEMAAGVHPFRRDTTVQTLSAIIDATPALPASLGAADPLGRIARRCLEKDPSKRYESTRLVATGLRELAARAAVAPGTTVEPPVAASPAIPRAVMTKLVLILALAISAAAVPAIRSLVLNHLGPTLVAAPSQAATAATIQPLVPYWTLAVLNLVVLGTLAAVVLMLDPRNATVRAFAVVLALRGIVGVTATLGDGASASIARPSIAFDAATSTLLSGALAIFVLLYPTPRRWAGPVVLWTIGSLSLALALGVLTIPAALGVFRVAANGTLEAVSAGPLLSERAWYWVAIAVSAMILAVEHARLTNPELRRSALLIGIGLAIFPIYIAASLITLPIQIAGAVFLAYGGFITFVLGLASGAIAVIAAVIFVATELRHRDYRSAAGMLAGCGIAATSALLGTLFGGAMTVAGSVNFVLRGVWRFPLPILATYALLRHQLLGIDVHLKWTLRRGTVAAIFIAVFFTVASVVQHIGGSLLAYVAGGLAMGLLLFVLEPLRRLAARLADAALPRVRDPRAEPPARRVDAYRQAAELMLADGLLTPRKERALAALADELGIGAIASLEIRERALQKI